MFALTDGDAAGERSLVVVDAVVGNLEVVTPGVDEDAAAALGAVRSGSIRRCWTGCTGSCWDTGCLDFCSPN